jgi:hypothetical protein
MTVRTPLCEDFEKRSMIGRYVAGKLSEAEASELEIHFLTCARCQEDVRLALAIGAAPVVPAPARRSSALRMGGGLALAAGIAVLLLVGPWQRGAGLARLGQVTEAPIYRGVPVRGAGGNADSAFDVATRAYAEGRYDAAITGFDATLRAGADSVPAEFFRAAAQLMLRRNDEAAAGFRRVVAMGATTYVPEARYYLAKVLLRLGHGTEASVSLRRIGADRPELLERARALADSVDALER